MLKRPGSPDGIPWFFYKIRRRIHFLRIRGTLFHRTSSLPDHGQRGMTFSGKGQYLIILLNSTFLFLLAYLFVFIVKEIAVVIAAASFDIRSVMMYYDVEFMIRSRDWTEEAVKVVYSTGPLIALMISFLSVTLFSLTGHERWTGRLFLLWIILHSLTQSFGEMIFGAFLNRGFGWVLSYLYFNDTEKMLFVSAVLIAMLSAGYFLSRSFLLTGNIDFNFLKHSNRRSFLVSQIILPFFIGTGILFMVKHPLVNEFEFLVEGSMLLVIIPALIRTRNANDLFFDEEPRRIQIRWNWIASAIVAFILFRVFFWSGVRIY